MILYFAIALVGVLFLVAASIFGEVMDVLHFDIDDGVSPLSGKVIAAALTAFGATGMLTRYADWSNGIGALTSGVVALLVAASVWWGISTLYRQTASTDLTVSSMRDRLAEVTIGIPSGSVGEVMLTAMTSTRSMIARSADDSPIAAGTTVRIVATVGNTVIVEPVARVPGGGAPAAARPESGGSHG